MNKIPPYPDKTPPITPIKQPGADLGKGAAGAAAKIIEMVGQLLEQIVLAGKTDKSQGLNNLIEQMKSSGTGVSDVKNLLSSLRTLGANWNHLAADQQQALVDQLEKFGGSKQLLLKQLGQLRQLLDPYLSQDEKSSLTAALKTEKAPQTGQMMGAESSPAYSFPPDSPFSPGNWNTTVDPNNIYITLQNFDTILEHLAAYPNDTHAMGALFIMTIKIAQDWDQFSPSDQQQLASLFNKTISGQITVVTYDSNGKPIYTKYPKDGTITLPQLMIGLMLATAFYNPSSGESRQQSAKNAFDQLSSLINGLGGKNSPCAWIVQMSQALDRIQSSPTQVNTWETNHLNASASQWNNSAMQGILASFVLNPASGQSFDNAIQHSFNVQMDAICNKLQNNPLELIAILFIILVGECAWMQSQVGGYGNTNNQLSYCTNLTNQLISELNNPIFGEYAANTSDPTLQQEASDAAQELTTTLGQLADYVDHNPSLGTQTQQGFDSALQSIANTPSTITKQPPTQPPTYYTLGQVMYSASSGTNLPGASYPANFLSVAYSLGELQPNPNVVSQNTTYWNNIINQLSTVTNLFTQQSSTNSTIINALSSKLKSFIGLNKSIAGAIIKINMTMIKNQRTS